MGVFGAVVAVAGLAVGAGGPAGASPGPGGYTPLPGSVAPFVTHTRATGSVAGSGRLTIQVWLRPRLAAAARFGAAVSTPGSGLFQHYLSPAEYTARFGATSREAGGVGSWLRAKGFTGVHTDAGRAYVRATATAATIEAAFRTQLKLYPASAQAGAGRYVLRANDRPVSVPVSLADGVLGVTGLNNAPPIRPLLRSASQAAGSGRTVRCSHYYGQHTVSGLPEQFGSTTFPTVGCGYSARQLRAAYRARGLRAGRGQTIAFVEHGLTRDMFTTLRDYAAADHLPAPSPSRYRELSLGSNSCGDPSNGEEQLDVETAYTMAPGANQLVVGGDSCDHGVQGFFDADLAILNGVGGHPLASIASNCWESGAETEPAFLSRIENAFLVRAAGEGVGMYFSSGDSSGTVMPAADPFATAVGGTTLGIGKTGNRLFETGWSTGNSLLQKNTWRFQGEVGAAGGGPSLLWKEPSYQDGVVPPAFTKAPGGHVRSVPDISADADIFTGVRVGLLQFHPGQPPTYAQITVGGTSVAAPLVAGMVTAAQQGQPRPFGFLNPALYKLAGTRAFFTTRPLTSKSPPLDRGTVCRSGCQTVCPSHSCQILGLTTFDDQNPGMPEYTGQVTRNGYDNMTGLGTPDGPNFIKALRSLH